MVEQSRSIVTRLDRILQRVPGDRVALVMRARAYRVVGQYDRALQEVNRLLATRPDDIAVRRLRGEIQYAMADYGPALADFKTVLAARPGDPVVEAYAEHAGQALATAGFRPRHRR